MLKKGLKEIKAILTLKTVNLSLSRDETGCNLFKSFTRRHPRYFVIPYKSIGVAINNIGRFQNADEFFSSIIGKNSAAYFSRKAQRAGFSFSLINPNDFIDPIDSINRSLNRRPGKKLTKNYHTKRLSYPIDDFNRYYGVIKNGELVSYCWIIRSGEIAIVNRIMGKSDHLGAGIMYLLLSGVQMDLIDSRQSIKYVIYDTWFGASYGLRMYKARCGFVPVRAKWNLAELGDN